MTEALNIRRQRKIPLNSIHPSHMNSQDPIPGIKANKESIRQVVKMAILNTERQEKAQEHSKDTSLVVIIHGTRDESTDGSRIRKLQWPEAHLVTQSSTLIWISSPVLRTASQASDMACLEPSASSTALTRISNVPRSRWSSRL